MTEKHRKMKAVKLLEKRNLGSGLRKQSQDKRTVTRTYKHIVIGWFLTNIYSYQEPELWHLQPGYSSQTAPTVSDVSCALRV